MTPDVKSCRKMWASFQNGCSWAYTF